MTSPDPEEGSADGTAMEERCALSAAIRARLRRFAEDDDDAAILDAEADQECVRLSNLSVEDEALDVIASLQWTKTLIALDQRAGGDWRPGEELGWELYRVDAARLHPRMRDVLMLDPWPVHGPDLARDTELGCELLESAQSGGDGEVLRRAVLLFRGIVAATTPGDPALVPRLSNLGAALVAGVGYLARVSVPDQNERVHAWLTGYGTSALHSTIGCPGTTPPSRRSHDGSASDWMIPIRSRRSTRIS